jgi:hypothetical protein
MKVNRQPKVKGKRLVAMVQQINLGCGTSNERENGRNFSGIEVDEKGMDVEMSKES